jgi:ankyrin repeat protein
MTGISKEGMALVTCDLEALMRHQANGFDVSKTLPGSQQRNSLHLTLSSTTAAVDPDFVRYLIDQGVDVGAQDRYGYTPLHFAARGRRPEIIQILIDAGAPLDVKTLDRPQTPFFLAISPTDPCPECIDIFLAAGAAQHDAVHRNWLRTTAHTIPGHEFIAELVGKYIDPELEPVEPG